MTSHAIGSPDNIVDCGIAVAPVSDWRYYGKKMSEICVLKINKIKNESWACIYRTA